MTMLETLIRQHESGGNVEAPASVDLSAFSESKQYSFFQINQLLHRDLNKRNLNETDLSLSLRHS